MATGTGTTIRNVDGFEVLTPRGFVGWVEETWLDDRNDPTAFVLRISDGRRGLIVADTVMDCVQERRSLLVNSDVRVLELEPPHVASDGGLTATWRTTGAQIELPEPPGPVHHALVDRLHRPAVPTSAARPGERPLWQVLMVMYSALFFIALALIGLDFLVSYVSTGRPPY
jgi:hypothetical protein